MRKTVLPLLTILLLFSISIAQLPENILQDARNLKYEGILIESASQYERYLLQQPNDIEARFELIEVLEILKRKEQVIAHVKILRKQVPDDPRLEKYSQIHIGKEKMETKVREFEKNINSPNVNPSLVLDYARYCAGSGLIVRAFELYNRYLQLRPNDDRIRLEFAYHLGWNKRYTESQELLNEILNRNPNNIEARLFLADINYWQGKDEEAMKQYENVLMLSPANKRALDAKTRIQKSSGYQERKLISELKTNPDSQALILLAKYYYSMDRFYEADSLIKIRLQRNPEDREAKKLFDEMQEKRESFLIKKIAELEETIRQQPDDNISVLQLARYYSAKGDFARSLELYDQYLSKVDADLNIRLERANVLNWKGDYTQAIEEFQNLLHLLPDNHQVKMGLAYAQLYANQNLEEVEIIFQNELERNPKDLSIKLGFAEALFRQGKYDQARQLFNEIVKLDTANVQARKALETMDKDMGAIIIQAELAVRNDPSDLQAKKRLLGLYLDVNRYFEAEQLLNELLRVLPNDSYLKAIKNDMDRYKKTYAIEELKKVKIQVHLYPDDLLLRSKYAQLLVTSENYKDAAEQYRLLIERDPNNPQYYIQLAELYVAQKKLNDARLVYQKLIERYPRNSEFRSRYAQVLAWSGYNDDAINEYKSALALYPNSTSLLLGLADIYRWRGENYAANELYQKVLSIDPQNAEAMKGIRYLRSSLVNGFQSNGIWLVDNSGYRYQELGAALNVNIASKAQVTGGSGTVEFSQDKFKEKGWLISTGVKYHFSRYTSLSINSRFFQFKHRTTNDLRLFLFHDFSEIDALKGLVVQGQYGKADAIFELASTKDLRTWTEKLTVEKLATHIQYQIDTSWSFEGDIAYLTISDNNSRTDLWTELKYRVSPIFALGIRYESVSARDSGNIGGYWAPKDYSTVGGWLKLANKFNNFSYEFKWNVGQIIKTKDSVHHGSAMLTYRLSERFTTSASYYYLRTVRKDGHYQYEGISGSLAINL